MHFQAPPYDHVKLVYCVVGKALDVILDIREGSPTFGKTTAVQLGGDAPRSVYVARGCAHGFLSLSEGCVMVYSVTAEYAPNHDVGILWSTISFQWPVDDPIVSRRDQSFPGLLDFHSPFTFEV